MSQFNSIRFQPSRPLLKEVSADRLNAIVAEIKRNRPRGERGITVRHSGDATYIGLAASIKSGAATARRIPFDIYVTDSDESSYTVKIEPGVVSGVLPTNYDEEFGGISEGELYYGIVNVTTDGEFVTDATFLVQSDPPQVQEPQKFGVAASVHILFGLFFSGSNYNLVNGKINARATNVLAVPADTPTVGSPPFDVYYLLQ